MAVSNSHSAVGFRAAGVGHSRQSQVDVDEIVEPAVDRSNTAYGGIQ